MTFHCTLYQSSVGYIISLIKIKLNNQFHCSLSFRRQFVSLETHYEDTVNVFYHCTSSRCGGFTRIRVDLQACLIAARGMITRNRRSIGWFVTLRCACTYLACIFNIHERFILNYRIISIVAKIRENGAKTRNVVLYQNRINRKSIRDHQRSPRSLQSDCEINLKSDPDKILIQ